MATIVIPGGGTSSSISPSGTIIVAKTGGDYDVIANGLAAASSGDSVVVYPGTYAESVTIPAGVRLTGFPNAQAVIISGADAASTRVTMPDTSTLREITVVGPSSGANPAVDCSGLGVGELGVLNTVVVQGNGGSGPLILGAGSGLVALLDVYHNGGTTTGAFVSATAGTFLFDSLTANAGVSAEVFKIGNATVEGQTLTIGPLYSCTDGITMAVAGGSLQADGVVIHDDGSPPAVNALHFEADGVDVSLTGAHIHGSTWDVLVDGGLTGTSTKWLFSGELTEERFSAPSGWATTSNILLMAADSGIQNDYAWRVGGEFTVGAPFLPAESALGEGDSSVTGMYVFSDDGTGTSWVDNTTAAKSRTGSTFAFLQGTTAGHVGLVGSESRQFTGLKATTTIAQATGAGAGVWEYSTGAGTWAAFNVMASRAEHPYTQYAQATFERAQPEQIRWDADAMAGWVTATYNGQSAYWVRYRVTTGITTAPTLQRTKLGTNRTEINKDGSIEFFGKAVVKRTFWQGNGEVISAPSGGANGPTNLDVTVSTNISYRQEQSQYANGSDSRRAGTMIEVPDGVDTSRPIKLRMAWKTDGTDTNTVQWDLYTAEVPGGAVLGALTETLNSQSIAGVAVAETVIETDFEVNIPNLVPGDFFAFTLWRKGSTDANGDAAGVLAMQWEGSFWQG